MKLKFERANYKNFFKLRNLYQSAFPDNERAPFLMLWAKSGRKNVDFWAIYADEIFSGLLYIVHDGNLSYIFYLAVSSELRGQGIGSRILQALCKLYKENRICLAIEELDEHSPNYAERVKRKHFYMKNGFEELHHKVIEGTVIFELLGVGGDVLAHEYENLMHRYIGEKMFGSITIKMIT